MVRHQLEQDRKNTRTQEPLAPKNTQEQENIRTQKPSEPKNTSKKKRKKKIKLSVFVRSSPDSPREP